MSDLKVRQAIAYAVNKEEITKGLTYGYETPATSLFAPGAPYTDITYNSTWSYDLDKANALLDEAGWVMNESTGIREKDGQQLSLNYTYWTDLSLAQDMALAIKTQLAEVGIDVTTGIQKGLILNRTSSCRNPSVLILMLFPCRHLRISRAIRMR